MNALQLKTETFMTGTVILGLLKSLKRIYLLHNLSTEINCNMTLQEKQNRLDSFICFIKSIGKQIRLPLFETHKTHYL